MLELAPKDTALFVKITHTKPIEIKDFVETLDAIGNLFEEFCRIHGDSSESRKAKLYVKKIEHGSIEIFLTEVVTALALPFIENINLIFEFAGHLKNIIEYFTLAKGEKPNLDSKELKQYHNVFAITAGDNKGTTEIGAVNIGSPTNIYNNCSFNYAQSNSAQNQIKREAEELKKDSVEVVHKRQLMKIFQMRGDIRSNAGNIAIIDALNPKPLPVVFETDELKVQILKNDENPTKQAYLVDVIIQTINGSPTTYKVMNLHDIIPLEEI